MGITRRRRSGQVLVVFAITASAMLATVGVLYSFGVILAERRALQTAADAASLAGTWQVMSELASDNRSDPNVLSTIDQFAANNGVNPADVTAMYLDGNGVQVGTVGANNPFPTQARGVRVSVSGKVSTILPGFLEILGVLVQDSAAAAARPTSPPAAVPLVIPIAIAQSAYVPHTNYDLFAGHPPGAGWSTLDFSANGLGAPTFGSMAINEQYWSDGQHSGAWQLRQPVTVDLAGAAYYDAVAAGLLDNVRRQALTDAAGRAYAVVVAPVYDSATSTSIHVTGFVQLKLFGSSIGATSATGMFVPYVALPFGTPIVPTPDLGATVVGITS
jgi:hypothetical protein